MTLVLSSLPPVQLTCPLLLQISTFFKDLPAFKAMVGRIEAPALCIDQESDAPAGQAPPELLAGIMQDAQGFAVPLSYHQVHQDQPGAVNALILTFLRTKVCHTRVGALGGCVTAGAPALDERRGLSTQI